MSCLRKKHQWSIRINALVAPIYWIDLQKLFVFFSALSSLPPPPLSLSHQSRLFARQVFCAFQSYMPIFVYDFVTFAMPSLHFTCARPLCGFCERCIRAALESSRIWKAVAFMYDFFKVLLLICAKFPDIQVKAVWVQCTLFSLS